MNLVLTRPKAAALGAVALALFNLQALRMALFTGLRGVFGPLDPLSTRFDALDSLTLLLVALAFLVLGRRGGWLDLSSLGLSTGGLSRPVRRGLLVGAVALTALLGVVLVIAPELALENLRGVLLFPLLEEILFRGWVWGRLRERGGMPGPAVWLLTALLFALWHLGYVDVVALKVAARPWDSAPLSLVLGMKALVGLAVGLLAGLGRWKTGSAWAAVLLHGLWNLFGR